MTTVAVVAHAGKTLDGGLDRLRAVLAHEGVDTPLWYEVPKSKKAPDKVQEAVDEGADLVFVWGGDGMVQRSVDALRDPDVAIAIVPAGTANLLAGSLGIPEDIQEAVAIGLHGRRRKLDVGVVNGERFIVMAGTGFDARMIRDADKSLKGRVGRVAYLWTGARNLTADPVGATIRVDGADWFEGDAGCVLVGNVGTVLGGLTAFPDAAPDDGVLELGVLTVQPGRVVAVDAGRSPLLEMTDQVAQQRRRPRRAAFQEGEADLGEPVHHSAHDQRPARGLTGRREVAQVVVDVVGGGRPTPPPEPAGVEGGRDPELDTAAPERVVVMGRVVAQRVDPPRAAHALGTRDEARDHPSHDHRLQPQFADGVVQLVDGLIRRERRDHGDRQEAVTVAGVDLRGGAVEGAGQRRAQGLVVEGRRDEPVGRVEHGDIDAQLVQAAPQEARQHGRGPVQGAGGR